MINIKKSQIETEEHYNSHPFEFLTKKDEMNIEELQPSPFIKFVNNYLNINDKVIDVGCGGGRASLYLSKKKFNTYAFDISINSLKLTQDRCKNIKLSCGTNLRLPFRTECFDAVISDGVIHHTPDAMKSLSENVRILKKKGYLYLAAYKKEGYYYYMYTYFGKPFRWIAKNKIGRLLITYTLGYAYYLLHKFKKKSPTTFKGSINFFYDYLLTPVATFYKKEELEKAGNELGLQKIFDDSSVGNVHIFAFQKR